MKQFLLFVVVVIALFGVLARCQTSGGYGTIIFIKNN